MKRLLVLVLLVPILALTMISCEGDMISNITGFMDSMGGNFYEDSGFITINTGNADDAIDAISEIGSAAGIDEVSGTETSSMGVSVTVASGTKLLAPQLKPKQDEVKNKIDKALGGSPAQIKVFLDDLKGDITPEQKTAASGTITVFNKTLEELGKKLNSDISEAGSKALGEALEKLTLPPIGDNPTKGDLLALQLMTDLISNTVMALDEIGKSEGGTGLDSVTGDKLADNKDSVLSIVNDALFAAKVTEQISGAGSIDFSTQFDLGGIIASLDTKGSKSSGDLIDLTDAEAFLGTINNLAPGIVRMMGVTYNGNQFAYTEAQYKGFLLNQRIYRASIEQALKMIELGQISKVDVKAMKPNLGTLVKYALAVIVTEHDAFWKDEYAKSTSTPPPYDIIIDFLNASATNKKLGLDRSKDDNLVVTDKLTPLDFSETGPDYESWFTSLDEDYIGTIVDNIIQINNLGGIPDLSATIEDGLSEWLDSLE